MKQIVDLIKDNIRKKEYLVHGILRRLGNKLRTVVLDYLPMDYRISVYNVNTMDDLKRVEHYFVEGSGPTIDVITDSELLSS